MSSYSKTGVAQRIVTLFFLTAFAPLLVLSVIAALQLDREQQARIQKSLTKDAKTAAVDLHLRLELSIDKLRFLAASETPVQSPGNSNFVQLEILETPPGASPRSPEVFKPDQVLLSITQPDSKGARKMFLATPLPYPDDSRWLVGELEQERLWGLSENAGEQICIHVSIVSDFVHCNRAASNTWRRIALMNISGNFQGVFQQSGLVTAYWSLAKDSLLDNPVWTATVTIPNDTAFANLGDFAKTLFQVIAMTLFMIALASLRVIRSTLQPLGTLIKKTDELTSGNLATRIELTTQDEFESLGESFNTMASQLGSQLNFQHRLAELGNQLQSISDIDRCHYLIAAALEPLLSTNETRVVFAAHQNESTNIYQWSKVTESVTRLGANLEVLTKLSPTPDIFNGKEISDLSHFDNTERLLVVPGSHEGRVTTVLIAPTSLTYLEESVASFCQQLGNLHANALANLHLSKRLQFQAKHDYLTELPNRMAIRSRVDELFTADANKTIAVAIFDIDRFKLINDSMGHASGDELLIEIARRLRAHLPKSVIPSRFAGDEFILLDYANCLAIDSLSAINERIVEPFQQTFYEPFILGNSRLRVRASLGIAISPKDGSDFIELLKNADLAMYEAKRSNPGSYCLNNTDIQAAVAKRSKLELALSSALRQQEMTMHYQPIVNLDTQQVIGCEALMRWTSESGEMISPGEFIPVAEETGHILELGQWALQESCRAMKSWIENGKLISTLAVNVSGAQLKEPNFVASVIGVLENIELPARFLEIEITETSLVEDVDDIVEKLSALRKLGIRVSIDDFGTGYSSLQYLKNLPADKLKIDQSFVKGLNMNQDDLAIVKTIISLGKELNLTLLAEGCETIDQVKLLKNLAVDFAQGWYYSKALPEKQFEALLPAGTP